MPTIGYVANWAARLRTRLYAQFRDKVTWKQWADLLGRQQQVLEDATQTLLTILDIDASEGVQLDVIGRIVGQLRTGVEDATYRLYLRARILANRSTGTPENIYSVMRALFGEVEAQPLYIGGWVKQFVIHIGKVLTRTQALVAVEFLHDSKEAGARGLLEWQEYEDSLLFEFASADPPTSTTLDGGLSAFGTFVQVVSIAGFPSSGQVIVSGGLANQEYISYTGATLAFGTPRLTGLTRNNPQGHSAGDIVAVIFGDGLGFDDGHFASAAQA